MNILRSVLGILLLGGIVFGAAKYGNTIMYQGEKMLHLPETQVKSAAIKSEVTRNLQNDAASGAVTAKKQVMQVKVSDVVGFFGRVVKIRSDITNIGKFVASEAGQITKRK